MSGLRFDNFLPKVIHSRTHGIIDYALVAANFSSAGHAFSRGENKAGAAALAIGGSIFLNALMTDYEYGVFRKWSFRTHGILDYGVSVASALMPKVMRLRTRADRIYFYGQSAGETLVAGITDFADESGSMRRRERGRVPFAPSKVA